VNETDTVVMAATKVWNSVAKCVTLVPQYYDYILGLIRLAVSSHKM